jgi:hypothetical protein
VAPLTKFEAAETKATLWPSVAIGRRAGRVGVADRGASRILTVGQAAMGQGAQDAAGASRKGEGDHLQSTEDLVLAFRKSQQ